MELRSLLLSQDTEIIQVLQRALDDLGIGVEVYPTAPWAGEDIGDHKFDAVIVDFDVNGAAEFLRDVRNTKSNSHSLTFAIVSPDTGLPVAFQMGANLALQKPISIDCARSSLRAAYGLIMQERRRYFRHPVETTVMISPHEHTTVIATTMNVSEGGMACKCELELQMNGLVDIKFRLPGMNREVECRAIVVWRDSIGRSGLRFEPMPLLMRKRLTQWLDAQLVT
jgi:CheY-like chemotaxis protein